MGSITRYKDLAISRAKRLSEVTGRAHVAAAGSGAITLAGSAAAGALDASVPEVAGVKPSIAAGLVLATGGLFTRSPKAIHAATGMLAPHVYSATFDAMASASPDAAPDDEGS